MRPKSKDRQKLIARVINEVADRLCTDCGEIPKLGDFAK